LGRDATPVQACPTEQPPLDDGDPPVVHLTADHGVARAGPHDDQVVLFARHNVSLAAGAGRIAVWPPSTRSSRPTRACTSLGTTESRAGIRGCGCAITPTTTPRCTRSPSSANSTRPLCHPTC